MAKFAQLTAAHVGSRRIRSVDLANRQRDNLHRFQTANDRAPMLNARHPLKVSVQPPVPAWFKVYLVLFAIAAAWMVVSQ